MPKILYLQAFTVTVGGSQHSGWLPAGAARPLPTPIRSISFNFEIEFDGHGFLLLAASCDGTIYSDTWYQTLEDAKEQASQYFGIPLDAWQRPPHA